MYTPGWAGKASAFWRRVGVTNSHSLGYYPLRKTVVKREAIDPGGSSKAECNTQTTRYRWDCSRPFLLDSCPRGSRRPGRVAIRPAGIHLPSTSICPPSCLEVRRSGGLLPATEELPWGFEPLPGSGCDRPLLCARLLGFGKVLREDGPQAEGFGFL